MSSLSVIGIGSPFGHDDRAWRVIDILRDRFATNNMIFNKLDRPGSQLITFLKGENRVIVIDTLERDVASAVLELMPEQLELENYLLSSHGFGIAETLQLAKAIQSLPDEMHILGLSPSMDITTLADSCAAFLEQALAGKRTQRESADAL